MQFIEKKVGVALPQECDFGHCHCSCNSFSPYMLLLAVSFSNRLEWGSAASSGSFWGSVFTIPSWQVAFTTRSCDAKSKLLA